MGIMDNLKAGVKNVASKTGEVAETTTLKTKITNLEFETDKLYKELGIAYYNKPDDFEAKSKELIDRIDSNLAQIEKWNDEIDKNKSEGKAEREANRQAAKESDKPEEKGGVEKIDLK